MLAQATTQSTTQATVTLVADGKFLGNSVWQWLFLLALLLGSLVLGKVVSFFLMRPAKRLKSDKKTQALGLLLGSIPRPLSLLIVAGGMYLAGEFMTLRYVKDGQTVFDLAAFWVQATSTLSVLAAGWFIYRVVDVVEFFLRQWTSRTATTLDDQLVPLVRKALRVFVVIVGGLFIAQNIFRWNVTALLTGLGLGGLAFALAGKDIVANLFGSVTIFADRPFQMGDRIKTAGHDGIVEEVGFRSTRIRTLTGHMVTVPNSVLANQPVENVTSRPYLKRVLDVTVTYDTPPEKLRRAVDIIREMLDARREHFHWNSQPRVFFSDFNADSLNIVVYYWFVPPDWWEYLKFNHEFNMELLRRFNEEGIEFAFPTQTLYVKQDSPIEAAVRVRPAQSSSQ